MLNDSQVTANIPAADLERARSFYAAKRGLSPTQENPGGLIYTTAGGTMFFLYQTEYAGKAEHTIAQFHVSDVGNEVKDLRAKGVTFEHYEMPGATWDDDVASFEDMGHAAWFKDSEGNILCVDDMTPA
ncbi:VOC family protein [Luteipulveratus mongoliensis]|uniref:Glyoxalase n=1 Tax=Luteipulveratus mongoliensis TaxID=571913 RepID=A0A0K1JJS3_9MICO|nr:VOC family protein [Luteipulveratus mongoliensis]AKU16967.1 glyoxalase [Luteipulveratus mongoliensis]